jgi:hypothetical protein
MPFADTLRERLAVEERLAPVALDRREHRLEHHDPTLATTHTLEKLIGQAQLNFSLKEHWCAP